MGCNTENNLWNVTKVLKGKRGVGVLEDEEGEKGSDPLCVNALKFYLKDCRVGISGKEGDEDVLMQGFGVEVSSCGV